MVRSIVSGATPPSVMALFNIWTARYRGHWKKEMGFGESITISLFIFIFHFKS